MQIGRTKSSAVYIKDPAVSQKHARVEWTGSKYTITDLGSSNGTTVNEKEIREGEPRRIRHGDVVVVGTDTMRASLRGRRDGGRGGRGAREAAARRGGARGGGGEARGGSREARGGGGEGGEDEGGQASGGEGERRRRRRRRKTRSAKTHRGQLPSRGDETKTVEAFLTETAERLISQIRDLAEAEVAALRTETEAVKAELRAECAAAA